VKTKHNAAFTLIEILVAIAIVALVSVMVFPNFINIRQKARDTKRKSDILQIQKALELYKTDQLPPAYPDGNFLEFLCNQCWSQSEDCTGNIYMRKVPCDPGTTADMPYIYVRDPSDGLKYSLSGCLESTSDPDEDPVSTTECADLGKESFTVYEP